jgi:hypothetical protein
MGTPGQPTKYRDNYPDKVHEYLKECVNDPIGETREGQPIPRLPALVGLALKLKVNIDTISEWRKVHPLFSVACKALLETQQLVLIQYGAAGVLNSTIVSRMLSANHGMSEKKELKLDGTALPTFIIQTSETIEDDS